MEVGLLIVKCRGHPNVQLTHSTTLEFAREPRLTPRGDCIACVSTRIRLIGNCKGYARGTIVVVDPKARIHVKRFTGVAGDCTKPVIRRSDYCREAIACKATIAASSLRHLARILQSPFTLLYAVITFYESS